MKQICTNYTFNATAKTVTLTGLNIPSSQVLLVAGQGKILYSVADGLGALSYQQNTNSVLTLQSSQGLSSSDKLTIIYDDGAAYTNAPASVSVSSSALPSGAATSAKQDTGNTSLASIDGKTPALGQALAASSVPVVLTAAQLSTLTPPAAITGYALESGGNLAALAGKDFATQTTLAATNVLVGAVTESAPASDTASSGLNGRLQRIAQRITSLIALLPASLGQKTMANSFPVCFASDQSVSVAPVSAIKEVAVELTRPSDTTAYTSGDIVSNSTVATTLMEFASVAATNGASCYITGIHIITDKKAITPQFRLHFWNASDPTTSADNAANRSPLYADDSKYCGYWDMPPMQSSADTTNGTSSWSTDESCRIPVKCGASTTSLWVLMETLSAFTPSSGQKFRVTLKVDNL